MTSLLALGLGTVIRRTAGAIATAIGLILILPVMVQGLPASWQTAITRYLPSAAGQAITGRTKFTPPGHLVSPSARVHAVLRLCRRHTHRRRFILNRRDA